MSEPALFEPFSLRAVTIPNRVGASPMCMYASRDGMANDYHKVHLGRLALGGVGLVLAEATAIEPRGRISHHDLGLWRDEQIAPLREIADFLTQYGAVPGIQLAHAGRKGSVREPWFGGTPLTIEDELAGTSPWDVEGPSAISAGPGWPVPSEMTASDIERSIASWGAAARRAAVAGFRVIELHGAHGYLLHSFLSPISNRRTDDFGGSPVKRMRYPLRVIEAVREAIGDDLALFYRTSVVDGVESGLDVEATIEFAREAAARGVDLLDTSSGGIVTDRSVDTRVRRGFAFHADFAREIRRAAGIPIATVGLIVDPTQAELLVERGETDLVLLGRQLLDDPNWTHHARSTLGLDPYPLWHVESSSALADRARRVARLAANGESPLSRFALDSQ